jgi:hypothetical protein
MGPRCRPTTRELRLTLPRRPDGRLSTPSVRERGRCSSPTSATDPTSRAPAMIARFPVCPRFRGGRLLERAPRDMPSRVALDGAPRASIDSAHDPRQSGGYRAPLISWWAPISASPRRGAPRSAALSSAGGECASTSDTPCRDVLRAFRRAARHRDRLPPDLVKGRSCERSRAPSIDECPHRPAALPFERTTALEREPATGARAWPPVTRLPTLFRRPAPEGGGG